MKHKITILFITMVALLIVALLIFNSAETISDRLGLSVNTIDTIAKAMILLTVFPSAGINNLRKEAHHE